MHPIIRAEGIGKCYQVSHAQERGELMYRSLRDDLMNLLRWRGGARRTHDFWALRDVSFEIQPGEVIGVIGRNGSGKSTLLKVLSRITKPNTGRIELRGRVGSLLEVGTGFHPELTGCENIYLNGVILGMKRHEINRKFDAIVDFAEVEKFLDTPVKYYSSGMFVRLAFAVAAHLEPEVLIVDEVLAVGDAEFQRKCLSKMGDVAGQGRTILFVSHNTGAVQALCHRAFLLSQGRLVRTGPVREVLAEYIAGTGAISTVPLTERRDRRGSGRFRFESVHLLDADGRERNFAVTGEDLQVQLRLTSAVPEGALAVPLDVGVVVRDQQGNRVTELATCFTGNSPARVADARRVTCHVPRLPLVAGQYRLDLWCSTATETQDNITDAAFLRVEAGHYFRHYRDLRSAETENQGGCMIPQRWSTSAESRPCESDAIRATP